MQGAARPKTPAQMKKMIVSIGASLLAGAGMAQSDSLRTQDLMEDSTAYVPDSVQGIAFTRNQIEALEYDAHAAARAREERKSARASKSTAAPVAKPEKASGKGAKRKPGGSRFSLDLLTDRTGSKHWRRMNKRSTRRSPDSPPGTVAAH